MNEKSKEFITKFIARVPEEVSSTFTDEQLAAVAKVFGKRMWGDHKIDIRSTHRWFKINFYYVLLFGKEGRDAKRIKEDHSQRPLWTFRNTITIILFLLMIAGTLAMALYFIEIAFNIEIFSDNKSIVSQT